MKNDTKRRGFKSLSKKYSATISIIVPNIQISKATQPKLFFIPFTKQIYAESINKLKTPTNVGQVIRLIDILIP